MKKVSIVLDTMINGGAHRIACMQANELSERGYDVSLILLSDSFTFPYEISDKVKILTCMKKEDLEFSSVISKIKRRLIGIPLLLSKFKQAKPDVVVSHCTITNRQAIICSKLVGVPVIAWEHYSHLLPTGLKGKFSYIDRRFVYKLADKVVVLTNYDKERFYDKYHDHVMVMNNPCPFEPTIKPQNEREKVILAAGDLNNVHIKGWDRLIEVFSNVAESHPEWSLSIAGSGENGAKFITGKAKVLGIADRVNLLGSVNNLDKVMQKSSIFILSSRYEGLPMVLIEAMSQSCCCIAFNCKTGVSEIISHSKSGLIVEDGNIDLMSLELSNLISDIHLREKLSSNGSMMTAEFQKNVVFDKLVELIEGLV